MDLTCYTNEIEQIDSKQKEYEKDNDGDEEEENDEEDEESILAPTLKKNLLKVEEEFHSCINYAEPLHIFLKMKPFSRTELTRNQDQNCYQIYSDSFIRLNPPKSSAYSKNPIQAKKLSNTMFKFSFIFDAKISQKEFFMASIYPCINKLLSGDNLLVISYGVTNSGKTYTMQGTNSSPGIIPRTLDVFFSIMKENLDLKTAYKYKPDKFNEISLLSESELQQEIAYKEQLLKQCSLMKDYNHDNEAAANASSLLDSSKYCFSTESLSCKPLFV
jgi:kinesin family protein 20